MPFPPYVIGYAARSPAGDGPIIDDFCAGCGQPLWLTAAQALTPCPPLCRTCADYVLAHGHVKGAPHA